MKAESTPLTVHIIDDPLGGIYVDREPTRVDSQTNIEWVYTGTNILDFTVEFKNGSPFKGKKFPSHGKKAESDGLGQGVHPNPKKVYKYTVTTNTGETIDPGVIIH